MSIKAFFEGTLASLTLRARTVFKIFEKTQAISLFWLAVQEQTSTSRPQSWTCFNQILVQNLINLVLHAKSDRK